jgi:uncharacterized protein Yka (UPF0111/DUF47 family)
MPFWKRLFGKDEKFFDLLEASAHEASAAAASLKEFLERLGTAASIDDMQEFSFRRHKDKEITQQITRQLCRTFVTPLEREDIEELSNSLYKIPKTVQKISERLLICPLPHLKDKSLQRQVDLLEQAAKVVVSLVKLLRPGASLDEVGDLNDRLQQIEGEADRLVTTMLRELYHDHADARDILILKDAFELIERAVDRCRDAGNTVFQIVLKSS